MQKRIWYINWMIAGLIIFSTSKTHSQCKIKNLIAVDGTMYYYLDPQQLYHTTDKELLGTVVTDKENYFLTIQVFPFPPKKTAEKLKDSLTVLLANNKQYKLGFFNLRYSKDDSLFRLMYLIDKDLLQDFRKHDINIVTINMGDEGERVYELKLHRSAIRNGLACFIKEEKIEN